MLKGTTPAVYQYGSEWITLDEFESPLLWALLAEAGRLGIALAGSDVTPEVVLRGAASVGFDARAGAEGELSSCRARFTHRRGRASPSRPRCGAILGHGLYRFDFDAGASSSRRCRPRSRRRSAPLLDEPRVIRVPAAEVPLFLRGHYHSLARSLPVTSRDGSFDPPPLPPATLVLSAAFEPHDVLRLDWHWQHADGRTSPVEASVAAAGADPELDDDLLARVVDELGWVPLEAVLLRGIDAAEFTAERMPRLERLADRQRAAHRRHRRTARLPRGHR